MSPPPRSRPAQRDRLVISLIATRHAHGLTVRALAAKTGLAVASISEWENGHHEPTLTNLRAWAIGLGLEPVLAAISHTRRDTPADLGTGGNR